MAIDTSAYHRAVAAEINRHRESGLVDSLVNESGLDHILQLALDYASGGLTVRAGVMIVIAREYIASGQKNSMQRDIETFMQACEQEVRSYPGLPDDEIRDLRIRLIREEWEGPGELLESLLAGDLVGIADGIADSLYVIIGTAAAYGIDIQEIFDEVHRSNMSKTIYNEDTGKYTVVKNEFGKVLKPESYSPPKLHEIVREQIKNGLTIEHFMNDSERDTLDLGSIDI